MNLPDFLTEHECGAIRLTGHRIDLMHVVDLYNEGHTPEMIVLEFDTLSLYTIEKVIAFYMQNKTEVDAYIVRCRTEIDRQMAQHPPGPSREELKKRWEAMRQAQSV